MNKTDKKLKALMKKWANRKKVIKSGKKERMKKVRRVLK